MLSLYVGWLGTCSLSEKVEQEKRWETCAQVGRFVDDTYESFKRLSVSYGTRRTLAAEHRRLTSSYELPLRKATSSEPIGTPRLILT